MDILNTKTLDQLAQMPDSGFDPHVLKRIAKLQSSDALVLLYNSVLALQKHEDGVVNLRSTEKQLQVLSTDSPELKTISHFVSFVCDKIDTASGVDKVEYLNAAATLVDWLSNHVTIRNE